jgi:hypothetical protein
VSISLSGLRSQLFGTANVAATSLTPCTLMMEPILSSETSVLTRATRRHIQEESILLKSSLNCAKMLGMSHINENVIN